MPDSTLKMKNSCRYCNAALNKWEKIAHDCRIPLPDDIRRQLEALWFIYGNNGPKHDQQAHYYIQRLIEGRRAEADRCSPSKECKKEVKKILEQL